MKKILRIVYWAILLLLVVSIVSLLVLVQTGYFKTKLREFIQRQVQASLAGELTIGKVEGDPFLGLALREVAVRLEGKPVVTVDRIGVQYDLLSLLGQVVHLRNVMIENPRGWLVKLPDGTWNVSHLLKPSEKKEPTKFEWKIQIDELILRGGQIQMVRNQTPPTEIRNLHLYLRDVSFEEGRAHVSIASLAAVSTHPTLELEDANGTLELHGQNFSLKDLTIRTKGSRVRGHLQVRNWKSPRIDCLVEAEPLALAEVRKLAPEVALQGNPTLVARARGTLNKLILTIAAERDRERYQLQGWVNVQDEAHPYRLKARVVHGNFAAWLGEPRWKSDLNFELSMQGQGVRWGKLQTNLELKVQPSQIAGHRIGPSRLVARIDGEKLTLDGDVQMREGRVRAAGWVKSLTRNPRYAVAGSVSRLDLAEVTGQDTLRSNLNFDFDVAGRGFDLETLTADAKLSLHPSTFMSAHMDSVTLAAKVKDGVVKFTSLKVPTDVATFAAEGQVDLKNGEADVAYSLTLRDLSSFGRELGIEKLEAQGTIAGTLKGSRDSLSIAGRLDLRNLRYDEYHIGELPGEFVAALWENRWQVDTDLQPASLVLKDTPIERANLQVHYVADSAQVSMSIEKTETQKLRYAGAVRFERQWTEVTVESLILEVEGQRWENVGTNTLLRYTGQSFELRDLTLASAGQVIWLEGVFDLKGAENLRAEIRNLDLRQVVALAGREDEIEGTLELQSELTGDYLNPVLHADVWIFGMRFYDFAIDSLRAHAKYEAKRLEFKFTVAQQANHLIGQGTIPMDLTLAEVKGSHTSDQVDLQIQTAGIDLAIFQSLLTGITNVRGSLVASVALTNTLKNPIVKGSVELKNGQFRVPEWGTDYRDLTARLSFEGDRLVVENFELKSKGSGTFRGQGTVRLKGFDLPELDVRIAAKNFWIRDNDQLRSQVDADLRLSGSLFSPRVEGQVINGMTEINLAAWEAERIAEREAVAAPGYERSATDTTRIRLAKGDLSERLYEALRGTLSLEIPRQVWLRDPELNMEIQGNLQWVKDGPDYVLFGPVEVLRGTYTKYGKKFRIEKGRILFKGDPDLNADLALAATYSVRDVETGELVKIQAIVGGTLYTPQLTFQSEPERDQEWILSMLVFGRPLSLLTPQEQASLEQTQSLEAEAGHVLAGFAAQRLAEAIGKQLGLEVLELESAGGLSQARVTIGKYITEDVYVSYTQSIGNLRAGRRVAIEYEITPFLSLRASRNQEGDTGFDLILKREW